MQRILVSLMTVAALALPGAAGAALIDRGGGLIYDDVLDITWLQDANHAVTSGFAAANAVDNGTTATDNISSSGQMGWDAAVAWAAGLEYFDSVRNVTWGDWRLPMTTQPDPSCSNQTVHTPPQGFRFGCTGSEMGHLYNVDGISAVAPGLFMNVQSNSYWSGSEIATFTFNAWSHDFAFPFGNQSGFGKFNEFFAWAVRSGDVEAAPGVGSDDPDNPELPVNVQPGTVFEFEFGVRAGTLVFIDPDIAIGYDYAIGAGDPGFRSVLLPEVGDNIFDLILFDPAGNPFDTGIELLAGLEFDFLAELAGFGVDAAGLDRFGVRGIETSAMLYPQDPTAFVTGLTFVDDGRFTGTMTPVVASVVSETGSLVLVTTGLLGLVVRRRRIR